MKRNIGLDFLRGIAVILVLFAHSDYDSILQDIGWVGVDLFFVLSGFLVSGLVFKEFKRNNSFDAKRFLIRRGFKIYPPFYIFLLTTIILNYVLYQEFFELNLILREVFYLQSYKLGIWHHTWTLALEEHFYLLLTMLSVIIIGSKIRFSKTGSLISIFLLIVLVFTFRYGTALKHIDEVPYFLFKTHIRGENIIWGILIAYLYHFTNFYQWFSKRTTLWLLLSVILFIPNFFFIGGGFVLNTFGITLNGISFSVLVLIFLNLFENKKVNKGYDLGSIIFKPILFTAYVGLHSYSIYLWHLLIKRVMYALKAGNVPIYFLLALTFGIIFSIIIEKPFLKIRDKNFPSVRHSFNGQ
ncbi:MAG: acyltransferase [Bacteroidota bacterium]